MNNNYDIGKELLTYAKEEAEFTAQRSLMDDLFPFIYVASKRMSLRAISRWLKDAHGISISYNALANAMRNPEKRWADLVEDIESAARVFAGVYEANPGDILQDYDLFLGLEMDEPGQYLASDPETSRDVFIKEYGDIEDAARILRNRWFNLPEEARVQCYRHFGKAFGKPDPKKSFKKSEVKKNEQRKETK